MTIDEQGVELGGFLFTYWGGRCLMMLRADGECEGEGTQIDEQKLRDVLTRFYDETM